MRMTNEALDFCQMIFIVWAEMLGRDRYDHITKSPIIASYDLLMSKASPHCPINTWGVDDSYPGLPLHFFLFPSSRLCLYHLRQEWFVCIFVDNQIARGAHASHSYLELLGIFKSGGTSC
jgi:hypothetical protein